MGGTFPSTMGLTKCCQTFQYKAEDRVAHGKGKFEISFTPEGGEKQVVDVFDFKGQCIGRLRIQ